MSIEVNLQRQEFRRRIPPDPADCSSDVTAAHKLEAVQVASPCPLILPLRPYQTSSFLYFLFVSFVSSLQALNPHQLFIFWGLEVPDHLFHRIFTRNAPLLFFLITTLTAAYTTIYRARNYNAFRHALARIFVALGYVIIINIIGTNFVFDNDLFNKDFKYSNLPTSWASFYEYLSHLLLDPIFHPNPLVHLTTLIHLSLSMREESLVYIRRLINVKKSQHMNPKEAVDLFDDGKDETEWALWWMSFVMGIVWLFSICIAALFWGSMYEKLAATVLGYFGWWLTYVQWYHHPHVRRPALPGNFHIYS